MEILVLFLVSILFLISLFNFITARSLRPSSKPIASSVSILIPMRNEAINAKEVVDSALAQVDIPNLEVIVLDDFSSDETLKILNSIRDERFRSLMGQDLPKDWLGKNFALNTLASNSSAEYLVFIDADVRLGKEAVSAAISLMNELGWDYISPYPRQIANGFLARTVQPLLQWSWFATLPLRLIENSRQTSTAVANGQFFMVKSSAYIACGGHFAIKGEVLDDLELARLLRRHGYLGSVVDASSVSSCEMYRSSSELIAGYSKSQWRAFGGTFGALVAIALMFVSSVLPAVALIKFESWAVASYLILILSRLMVAIRTRSVTSTAPLHPLAITIWIFLIFRSLLLKRMGKLEWRGRTI